jgi:electron transport complex protein RnfG
VSEPTALGTSLRTAAVMLVFTAAFTGAMAFAYRATKSPIDASLEQEKMKLVNEVLPPSDYDNALLQDYVETGPVAELGVDETSRVFRARKGEAPVALVLETVAPDGYGGRITLLVAVRTKGRTGVEIAGARVTQHKETPGLGDYIDIRKDRTKTRPWITQFNDVGFERVAPAEWKVKKDGGRFDQMSGATISARAVTNATGRALRFAGANAERIFGLPSGAKMQ